MLLGCFGAAGLGHSVFRRWTEALDPAARIGVSGLLGLGLIGTVTLFTRGAGAKTLVVVELAGEPGGRHQPASIHRGKACDEVTPEPAYPLSPTVNGVSRTLVEAPEAKLLSGNYVVIVHAADDRMGQYVSCGQLYAS